ncbi:MAG: hydroxylamine oxidoreductase [Methylococcales bacterium]|jgi:hydroxylamine dehydrogenase|nr:hydroxylamine oxidoreductase [Methylococcales bacterium]
MIRYPIIISLLAIIGGYFFIEYHQQGEATGHYSRYWTPNAVHQYWSPDDFYQSTQNVVGEFEGAQCVTCHQAITPGVVNDWNNSQHATNSRQKVFCNDCHGSNHQSLTMPTPVVCSKCHEKQHGEFMGEKHYGFPSHVLAMERVVDAKHFVDKPKAEVASCVQCHSVATKCDSCHSRHRFSAAEARRPEACITCHSGPPHPDDETYFASVHGQRYLTEKDTIDWSKSLKKGNYTIPTCAYCHLHNGHHQVADKTIWKFGLHEINPQTSLHQVKRQKWIKVCADCHDPQWSKQQLSQLDKERKRAWSQLYQAEDLLKNLRRHNNFSPNAKERPSYPVDWLEKILPHERIGFLDGQASSFYNVSKIERQYFEMWYFHNLSAYKGAAHNAPEIVKKNHELMAQDVKKITQEYNILKSLDKQEKQFGLDRIKLESLWKKGSYTEFNREQN